MPGVLQTNWKCWALQARRVLPGFVEWPEGFKAVFEFAYIGGSSARPREFDPIHRIGQDSPHYNYPLRNVAEESFIVTTGGGRGSPPRRVRKPDPSASYQGSFSRCCLFAFGERLEGVRVAQYDVGPRNSCRRHPVPRISEAASPDICECKPGAGRHRGRTLPPRGSWISCRVPAPDH
jgi:hypothetical protein